MRKARKNDLKIKVESILKEYPQARDNDVWLTLKLWSVFYSGAIQRDAEKNAYVYFKDILLLPREDNVKRIRAHFQNDRNEYLPTLWSVAKQRRINQEVWRKFARTGNFPEK